MIFWLLIQNFVAYNIATGNASPIEERSPPEDRNPRVKRRRFSKPQPDSCSNPEDEGKDGPMSHQDYIDKRRQLFFFVCFPNQV